MADDSAVGFAPTPAGPTSDPGVPPYLNLGSTPMPSYLSDLLSAAPIQSAPGAPLAVTPQGQTSVPMEVGGASAAPPPATPQPYRSPVSAHLDRMLGVDTSEQNASMAQQGQQPGYGPVPVDARGMPIIQPRHIGALEAAGDFLFGGLPTAVANANYRAQVLYPAEVARYGMARQAIEQAASIPAGQPGALTPSQLAAARLNPMGYLAQVEAAEAPVTVEGGSTRLGAGMAPYTAPKLIMDNGRLVTQGANGSVQTGNTGPSLSATPGGGVIDSRGIAGLGPVSSVPVQTSLAPGASLVQTGSAPGMAAGAGGAPSAAPGSGGSPIGAASPMWGAASSPRSLRNYNPGNLTALPNGQKWAGQTGVDPAGYVQFDSPESGRAAMMKNISAYAGRGINTVARAIGRWAPASAGNNTGRYASFVAQQMGVGPQDKIDLSDPATAGKFADAVSAYEAGPKAWAQAQQSAAAPPTSPAQAPGAQVIAQGKTVTPPVFNPKTQQWEQTAPDGSVSKVAPPVYGLEQQRAMINDVEGTPEWKDFSSAAESLNGLHAAMKQMSGNNGVIDNAATDSYYRTMSGGVMRPGGVKVFMEHLGVPQDIQGKVLGLTGNGYLTPKTLKQMDTVLSSYAAAKQAGAQRVLGDRQSLAKEYGGSFDMTLPALNPTPKVQWMDGGAPPAPPPVAAGQLQALLAERARRQAMRAK